MGPELRAAYDRELAAARIAAGSGDWGRAWTSLERIHVLGQRFTRAHVRAHVLMLAHGWRRRDVREIAGQLTRIAGAFVFTWLWIPEGNTGGSNVSAFRRLPIPDDLARLLKRDADFGGRGRAD